ncbi:MAG: PIG-L family deacetylase, partial [Myxococcota bacterium]
MTFGLDLLAFAPHPDDAEIFCGGLLIKMAQQSYRVGIVDLTQGEMGSNGDVPTRAREAAQAAEVMGLVYRQNLRLPDGRLSLQPLHPNSHLPPEQRPVPEEEGALERLIRCIRTAQPAFVLAPWKEARHPDHQVTHELVRQAVFFA